MTTERIKTGTSVDRYRALLEVNNAVITNLRREDLLPAICAALRRVMVFDAAALSIYEPKRDALCFFALEGDFRSQYFVKGLVLKLEDSVSGEAFRNQRPLFRRNIQTEQQYISERRLAAEGVRSTCIAPLLLRGASIGTLNITSFQTDQYSQEDADFLQEVANQVALAVANMNAYEEIAALSLREAATAARHRSLLEITNAIITSLTEEDLIQAVRTALSNILPFHRLSISIYDDLQDAYRFFAVEGLESNFLSAGTTISHKERFASSLDTPLLRYDLEQDAQSLFERRLAEEGFRSLCVVPLKVQKSFLGAMSIYSLNANEYRERDAEFLQEVGNQVALAVANLKSYEEIKALSAREARVAQRQQTLLEINNALITHLKEADLLHAVTETLKRVIACDVAGLALYEKEADDLRIVALEGVFADSMPPVGSLCDRRGQQSGHVWHFEQPVLRHHLESERQYTFEQGLYASGMQSHCTLPLIVHGEAIGTLGFASKLAAQYSETDLDFLREVSKQVALAVANMKAYEEVRALSEQQAATAERRQTLLEINNAIVTKLTKEELSHAVFESLERAVPFDFAGFHLYEPESSGLRFIAQEGAVRPAEITVGQLLPLDSSIAGEAFRLRRPALRYDLATERHYESEQLGYAAGLRSVCAVPLIIHGDSIGTLSVTSLIPNRYNNTDAEFLQEVANQVALSIDNMQAYEQMKALSERERAAAERRQTLLEINNAIVTKLTQQELCKAVFEALPRLVPFDRVGISLFDAEQDAYHLIAMSGRLQSDYFTIGRTIPRQENWVTDEFSLTRPLLLPDLENPDHNPFEQQLYKEGVRSFFAVPMLVKNKVIGAISVSSKTRNQYSQNNVEMLQEVANQVALAIANMQAFEEIAALKTRLQAENIYLKEEIRQEHNFDEIVGNSPALLEALRKVEQVARTDSTVLILGESGTGKELFARAIHEHSARKNRPLVKVNCGAISAGLVESELFGHTKGAFTGAVDKRVGRFELANGGTLFLDEVGELPLETQVKLLRVLQEGEFEPVGSSKTVKVDVRIIAATNRHLEEEVQQGRFRADLYYRLNVFPIPVPPLRERPGDIPQLAHFFTARFAKKFGKQMNGIAQETMEMLKVYPWHGNIRELQNIIERGVITAQGSVLTLDKRLLPSVATPILPTPEKVIPAIAHEARTPMIAPNARKATDANLSLEELERRHILDALQQTRWVIEGERGAAKILDLHPNTLRSRMKKLGIKRPAAN